MPTTDKFFVPREEIQKVSVNSFEHRKVRIEQLIQQEKTHYFQSAEPQIVATFESHAVVLTDDGRAFKVQFEEAATGAYEILAVEPAAVQVYEREAMPAYLRKEARAAADLFLKGLVAESNRKIAQISALMDGSTAFEDARVVDPVIQLVKSSAAWKKAIGEKSEADLKGLLAESFDTIVANELRPKFSKLYDGTIVGPELEKFRKLVEGDIGTLMGRMKLVFEQVCGALVSLQALQLQSEEQRKTVDSFKSFVEDLGEDLRKVQEAVAESLPGLEGVGAFGQLYDALAEELSLREMAGTFVVRFTDKLLAAVSP